MIELPEGLDPCDPIQRTFPVSWKEAYFRLHFDEELWGYCCPICRRTFRGTKGFNELRGDHKYPFSKGGLTTWENFQLICLRCNSQKGSSIDTN